MDLETHSVYQLGEFRFAPEDHRLSLDGEDVHLRPKTFKVLQYLVERHGHVVTREELLDAVWPETYVDEKALSRSVWEIREALRRNGEDSQLIQTVPKVGYRIVGPVSVVEAREPESGPRPRNRTKGLAAGLLLMACAAGLAWWVLPRGSENPVPEAVPLTTDPGMENWPTFSPDGSQVAFQGDVEGGGGAIFVKQIGEDASLRRTFGPGLDHAASWSPDGQWIAFLRGEASPEGPVGLMVVPPSGGPEREIAQIRAPVRWGFRPAWTPDSQSLIVPDREGSQLMYRLHRFSIAGGERTRLTVPPESSSGEGDKDPAVSPDGTRLAFTRNGDLHLVDLDGQHRPSGRPRSLAATAELGSFWGLAWTADSRDLVFAAGQWPWARLYRVSAAGGQVRPLTSLSAGTFAPAISTTGNRLAYMEWITSADIWRLRLDDDGQAIDVPTRLISSSRLDFSPVHSPDGGLIAFQSNRAGRYETWLASASGEEVRPLKLVDEEGGLLTPEVPSWSPDQKAIAFAAEGDLYVSRLPSRKCRALTTGSAVDELPVWSPDGRAIFFSSRRDGFWQVFRVPANGGQPAPVTSDGGRLRAVSPDGLQVYYAHDDKLWMIPSGGGEPVELLEPAPDYVVALERGFYHAGNVPTHHVQYVDLDSRGSMVVTELDRWIMGLSVSPDRSQLVYGLIDHKRADLMLVEDFE